MKNKEAIEHLRELKTLRIEFPNTLQEEALDLAIKVLEERPQSECCGSCYLCDVGNCGADMRKGSANV